MSLSKTDYIAASVAVAAVGGTAVVKPEWTRYVVAAAFTTLGAIRFITAPSG